MQKELESLLPFDAYDRAKKDGHQDDLQRIAMLQPHISTYILNYMKDVNETNIDILLEAVKTSPYYNGNIDKFLEDISMIPGFYNKYINEIESHPKFQELKDNIMIKEIIE